MLLGIQFENPHNIEKITIENEDFNIFKNEQIKLWHEMLENLRKLQETQSNPLIKGQIQDLERFSELNAISLTKFAEKKTKNNQKKPVLQINIEEEEGNLMNAMGSDKMKNTLSEENRSSVFGDSMKPNFKGETPPSNEQMGFENNMKGNSIFLKKPENIMKNREFLRENREISKENQEISKENKEI